MIIMPLPIKVSDVGRPLTCEEHDSNIDRLLDRTNHTGTQPASSIYDLESYLNNLSTLVNIRNLLNEYDLKIDNLEDELTGNGYISNLINSTKVALEQADSILRRDINSLISQIDNLQRADQNLNDLFTTVSERLRQEELKSTNFNNSIESLEDLVQLNEDAISDLRTLIDALDGNLNGIDLNALIEAFNAVEDVIQPLLRREKFLVPRPPNNSTGMIIKWDAQNDQPFWSYPDAINGGQLKDPLGEIRLSLNTGSI